MEKEFDIGERVVGLNGDLGQRTGTVVAKYRGKPSATSKGQQFYDVKWDDRVDISRYHMSVGLDKAKEPNNG